MFLCPLKSFGPGFMIQFMYASAVINDLREKERQTDRQTEGEGGSKRQVFS